MRIISVSPDDPREDRLRGAVDELRAGGVVAVPTETFYGLAADCGNPEALARIRSLKRKEATSPILLLAADVEQVESIAGDPPAPFAELARRFWPGPLTLVVPAAAGLPREVSAGRGTVAVRVPGLALPRCLAAALGRPVTGPSANRTGQPPCRSAADVARAFPSGLGMIVDGGPTAGGAASTIVDLCGKAPRILREGLVPRAALEPFLGPSGAPL